MVIQYSKEKLETEMEIQTIWDESVHSVKPLFMPVEMEQSGGEEVSACWMLEMQTVTNWSLTRGWFAESTQFC